MTPEEQIADLKAQVEQNQEKIKDLVSAWEDLQLGLRLLSKLGRVVRAVVCVAWKIILAVLGFIGLYQTLKHSASIDASTWLKAILDLDK